MGGITEVYIANHDDVDSLTIATGEITGITMVSTKKFKKYLFNPQTGSLTSTYNIDLANNVNFVTSELVLLFGKMETTKRIEISALALADLAVIVKDANGTYFYLGKDNPVKASAGDGQTGTARTDGNRYSITLQDNSPEMPYEVLVGTGGVDLSTIVE